MPVGAILPYIGSLADIPVGWHLCDGTDGTPNLTDRFLQGTVDSPGNFTEPGLPNIYGTFPAISYSGYSSGAIVWMGRFTTTGSAESHDYIARYKLDASQYNPIYRDDVNTVQPASYTVYYIIKIK